MAPRRKPNSYNRKDRYEVENTTLWYLTLADLRINVFEAPVLLEGFGPDIVLMFRKGNQSFGVEVTNWNAEEIAEFRKLMNKTLEVAEHICIGRDEAAREHESKTDRVFRRLYRPIPRLVETARAKRIDLQSILQRPVDVSDGDEKDSDSA